VRPGTKHRPRHRSVSRPAPRAVPLRFVPVDELDGAPHVVVDGSPRPGTRLTLSHWPGTPTPAELWADVSAEIVCRALDRPGTLPVDADAVTLDHFDADGMLSLALLVVEGLAETHRDLAVRAAYAGDFDVVHDRSAALVAFALAAMADLGMAGALARVPALLAQPDAFEDDWGPEAAAFEAACRMLADGAVVIEDLPELDLAVVTVDPNHRLAAAAAWGDAIVHPAAVHSATPCLRVATVAGRRYQVQFRYETWVRLASGRPRPRVDLSGLAGTLQAAEPDGGPWQFDGAGAITPRLRRSDGDESNLSPDRFRSELCSALAELDRGPAAWDPYAGAAPVG